MTFRLHHLTIDLTCPDAPVRAVLEDGLAFKGGVPAPDASSTDDYPSDATLVYRFDPAPAFEEGTLQLISPHDCGLDIYETMGGFALWGEGVEALIEPQRRTATVWLDASYGGELTEEQRQRVFFLLVLPLLLVLLHNGQYALHAAALAKDDRGLLISAPSGQGKTTATLQLVKSGWAYLSDDTVLLHRANGGVDGVQATSYRRHFSLTDETLAQHPELAARRWPPTPGLRQKNRVDLEAVLAGSFRPTVRPSVLLFPERVDGASRLETMPAWEVFGTLVQQSAVFASERPGVQKPYLNTLGALCRQCEAYRLYSGPDLLQPGRLDALLEDVWL